MKKRSPHENQNARIHFVCVFIFPKVRSPLNDLSLPYSCPSFFSAHRFIFMLDFLLTIISLPLLLFFHPSSARSVILFSLDGLLAGQHSDGAPDRKNPHSWLPLGKKSGNQDNPRLSGRVSYTESDQNPSSQSAAKLGWDSQHSHCQRRKSSGECLRCHRFTPSLCNDLFFWQPSQNCLRYTDRSEYLSSHNSWILSHTMWNKGPAEPNISQSPVCHWYAPFKAFLKPDVA